jgi:hypothetical protein
VSTKRGSMLMVVYQNATSRIGSRLKCRVQESVELLRNQFHFTGFQLHGHWSAEQGDRDSNTSIWAADSIDPTVHRRERTLLDTNAVLRLYRRAEPVATIVGPGNQSRVPQFGHGASPGGREGSKRRACPQTGQSFASPSGVRDEMFIACLVTVRCLFLPPRFA